MAARYDAAFAGNNRLVTPHVIAGATSSWAQYTLQVNNRAAFQAALKEAGVPTAVYYPIPLSRQRAYAHYPSVPTPVSGGLVGVAGGLPLYKGGLLVGGIGVAGDGDDEPLNISPASTLAAKTDEDVALAGQTGFGPAARILGTKVFIDGIALPYVASTTSLGVTPAVPAAGVVVPPYAVIASPGAVYPAMTLGGVTGELRQPIQADPAVGPGHQHRAAVGRPAHGSTRPFDPMRSCAD